MPAAHRHERARHARGAGAHHGHAAGRDGARRDLRHGVLEGAAGVDCALRVAALHELVHAALLAADTWPNLVDAARIGLVGPLGIGQQGPSQHHHVAGALAQGALGHVGVAQLADRDDGHGKPGVGLDAVPGKAPLHGLGHGHEAARRHARGRVGHPPVVVAAQIDVEEVHAGRHELLHVAERLLDRAPAAHTAQVGAVEHLLAIGLLQGEGEVDAVHDREVGPHAAADLAHRVQAKAAPVGVAAQPAVVEGGVGHLLEEIALVSVEVDAVKPHGRGVGGRLPEGPHDAAESSVREAHARHRRHVVVGKDARRGREPLEREEALRVADAAQTGRELHEYARAKGVDPLRQVAPAGHDGAAAVDARKVGEPARLGDRGVDAMAHGHEAGRDEAAAALGPGKEVVEHLLVGPTRLLAHVDVAHGRHDDAVLEGEAVHPDGREERVVGVELARHAGCAAARSGGRRLLGPRLRGPVVKPVNQLLYQGVLGHRVPSRRYFDAKTLALSC